MCEPHLEELRAEIQRGIDSGEPTPLDIEAIKELGRARFEFDQPHINLDSQAFQKVLDWLHSPATPEEKEGMDRLRAIKSPWEHG